MDRLDGIQILRLALRRINRDSIHNNIVKEEDTTRIDVEDIGLRLTIAMSRTIEEINRVAGMVRLEPLVNTIVVMTDQKTYLVT